VIRWQNCPAPSGLKPTAATDGENKAPYCPSTGAVKKQKACRRKRQAFKFIQYPIRVNTAASAQKQAAMRAKSALLLGLGLFGIQHSGSSFSRAAFIGQFISFFAIVLFLDNAGSLAGQAAQIIKLGPADTAAADNFNPFNQRRINRENTFHTFAIRDFADSESLLQAAAFAGNADAFVNLICVWLQSWRAVQLQAVQ